MLKHPKNGTTWGDWTWDTGGSVLVLDTTIDGVLRHYEIELWKTTDSTHMLDRIFQIRPSSHNRQSSHLYPSGQRLKPSPAAKYKHGSICGG
jgi:hypothetical protein